MASLKDLPRIEFFKLQVCCPECMAKKSSCFACGGSGLVCPTCRGARYLAKHREGDGSLMLRCYDCGFDTSQGWEYDPDKEMRAIERWLEDWKAGIATTTEATRRAETERVRLENAKNPTQPRRVWKHG